MTSMQAIDDFLSQKRIAVVGVSQKPGNFSRALFHELIERGYDAVPVNPAAQDIDGQRCFARVQEITPPVDGVLIMTSPAVTNEVVHDCAEAGVQRVWMFRGGGNGAVSDAAVDFCKSSGISLVAGECPFMFLPGASLIHRLHGFVRKIVGTYPVRHAAGA